MIAQGQFTRLLNATTEERSKIFRKLFRTQRYQKLQEALAEENSALTARRAALNAKLDAVLAGISYDAADPEAETLGDTFSADAAGRSGHPAGGADRPAGNRRRTGRRRAGCVGQAIEHVTDHAGRG